MYSISDTQIDHILNDIRARGVEMEDLQLNLLDHICCIIEQNLEENGDFESFYQNTIQTFYKTDLWEIEEETLILLTFKNYYTMKKMMILSGTVSTAMLLSGLIFKFMHWPGAATLLILGILISSIIFLPLLFTLKAKESQNVRDKIFLAGGTLAAISMSLSFLFKVMYWPGSIAMLYSSAAIMMFVFLPFYLSSGIRNPETKTNTIASSALIFLAYALVFMLIIPPAGVRMRDLAVTNSFLRSEQLLKNEKRNAGLRSDSNYNNLTTRDADILKSCEALKAAILKHETGYESIPEDFEKKNILLGDKRVFLEGNEINKLEELKLQVESYNNESMKNAGLNRQQIPVKSSLLDNSEDRLPGALHNLNQIELFVLQNERELISQK